MAGWRRIAGWRPATANRARPCRPCRRPGRETSGRRISHILAQLPGAHGWALGRVLREVPRPRHKVDCAARRGLRELVRIPCPIDELRVDETIGTPHDFAKAVRYSQANGGEYFCKRYVRNLVSFGTVVACGCKIPRTSRADSCDHACLFWYKSYARGCVRSIPQ